MLGNYPLKSLRHRPKSGPDQKKMFSSTSVRAHNLSILLHFGKGIQFEQDRLAD